MFRLLNFFVAIVLFTAVFVSCDDDDVKPDTATIRGTITMEDNALWGATWQDSGEVQVTIFPDFSLNPPAGWGEVPDGTFGAGVPGGTFAISAPYNAQDPVVLTYNAASNQYDYEIVVAPGTYSALAVGLRHVRNLPADQKTATLGVYWNNETTVSHGIVLKVDVGGGNIMTIFDFPAPEPITVVAGDEVELNFTADFGFVEDWY